MTKTNTFEAILMTSGTDGGRRSGQIHVLDTGVQFIGGEERLLIPFSNLAITAGGAANRLIFFNNTQKEVPTFYTTDKTILKHETLLRHPALLPQVKYSKRTLRKVRNSVLVFFAFCLISIGGLYLAKDYFVRKVAEQIPVSWEREAGDQLFKTLSLQYTFIKNDSLEQVFRKVAHPLLQQVAKKGVHVDIYFVNDPSINAFALPGGKVVIQSGLIQHAESWEEVLGVMGHELAHVTERHHARGIISNLGLYAILSAFFGDFSAIAGTMVSLGGDLASLANSRGYETEADNAGWDYLIKGKIHPRGMIAFFETLEKQHKGVAMSGYLSFLSTHPDTKERIANLRQRLKDHPISFPLIKNDFQAFKRSFNQQL